MSENEGNILILVFCLCLLSIGFFFGTLWGSNESQEIRKCAKKHNVFTCERVYVPVDPDVED